MTRIISIWRPYERLVNTNSVYKAGKNLVFLKEKYLGF